ncbi:putative diaminohydroxyphosphoribosylamino-pyrimidine deaminase protein [Botrytis fragariae]|uniref:Putative diaminohydroxyphosphoribosylamino-pyrimidine deaminase protein n=1 Tax=Botrytis fragariae TaxID=1964551 RepID=A0A8H6EJB6_9HELO|nr:putative diaminohydroxyphosphoribosylamino-pyrimidine deaminase protein [Botrytis fragariae]KAF5874352.1 putative diaminohydroxyphosphoribosylamino-pyrimidine deaminase protein [Botrytis fragariae]
MAGRVQPFLDSLGPEVEDPEEEAFLLFSQTIPSQNLGFVDSKATEIDFTINGRDLTIYQSPTILSSNRDGGTTGAVIWKITPLFAKWISSPTNPLLQHQIITPDSVVLELGCGISGLIALTLSPLLQTYILTDQPYVLKFLSQNLSSNSSTSSTTTNSKSKSRKSKPPSSTSTSTTQQPSTNKIIPLTLDWETDVVSPSLTCSETTTSFDTIIACDCIYNDALIPPFVQTCVDLCRLRSTSSSPKDQDQTEPSNPTLCVIAQQLRSPDVFESWLKEFNKSFRVWRVQEGDIQACGLGEDSGFVVHIGILR